MVQEKQKSTFFQFDLSQCLTNRSESDQELERKKISLSNYFLHVSIIKDEIIDSPDPVTAATNLTKHDYKILQQAWATKETILLIIDI